MRGFSNYGECYAHMSRDMREMTVCCIWRDVRYCKLYYAKFEPADLFPLAPPHGLRRCSFGAGIKSVVVLTSVLDASVP